MNTKEYQSLLRRLTGGAGARRQLVYAYELRDTLRAEQARYAREGQPLPEFSQHLLYHVEAHLRTARMQRLRQKCALHKPSAPPKPDAPGRDLEKRAASRPVRSRPAPPVPSAP